MTEEVPLDDFDVDGEAGGDESRDAEKSVGSDISLLAGSEDLSLDQESTFDRENAPLDVRADEPPDARSAQSPTRRALRAAFEFVASYFRELEKVFGARFLLLLFLVQFAIKGIVYQIVVRGFFPLLKDLNVEASTTQVLQNVAHSPWVLKPFFGVITDLLVIRRRSKKFWMLVSSGMGLTGSIVLIFGFRSIPAIVVGMFFLSMLGSWSDLLTEAKYSELLRENPTSGSRVVVFANGSQRIGYAVACALMLAYGFHVYQPVFMVVAACAASILIPTLFNYLPEEQVYFDRVVHRGFKHCFVLFDKLKEEWRTIAVVGSLGVLSPVASLIPLFFSEETITGLVIANSIFYATVALFVVLSYFAFRSKWITIVALYEVSKRVMRPRQDSALDFWYTATEQCVPGGPHLSYFIYITVACWVSVVAAVAGLAIYQSFFKNWPFRKIVLVTVLLKALGSSFDLIIIMRWNKAVGVPDAVAFLMGDAVLQPITDMLSWLPGSVLIAKVCPKGLESSVFAFLAGISNLALGGSELSGALLMRIFGIHSKEGACNFDALPYLVLGCHAILPILIGVPMSFLLPNKSQNEDII